VTPELLTFDEADARLDGALSACFQGYYDRVLFFAGAATFDGDLLPAVAAVAPGPFDLVAFGGDLTVGGAVAAYEPTPGVYVGGFTRAETLEGGDAEVYLGDGAFTHFVYGYYNDGILETGRVDTPWVVNADHDLRVTAPGATRVDNHGRDGDFHRDTIAGSFVPEVIDAKRGNLDLEAFLDRLREGLPVLLDGAMTARQRTLADVAAAAAAHATDLDLTGRDLDAFPAQVLAMPWLRTLVLDRAAVGALPDGIAALTALETLSVRSCRLTALPDTVAALPALRVLRVAGNPLPSLPAGLGDLEELDVSGMARPPAGAADLLPQLPEFELPGDLTGLRRLVADGTNVTGIPAGVRELSLRGSTWQYLRRVPAGLTALRRLRRLDLSGNYLDEIPADLMDLPELEELDLGNALGLLRAPLPDLSMLPRLRVLRLSGGTDHSAVSVPPHAVLRPVFAAACATVEELAVDRWGPSGKGGRGPLTAADLAGIGGFRALRVLDLSSNDLRQLPEELFALPLQRLDLRYNRLDAASRARVREVFPHADL
jgi:Leucine-rich repeat (LRR) protein